MKKPAILIGTFLAAFFLFLPLFSEGQDPGITLRQEATATTMAANSEMAGDLNFADVQDFTNADLGFIARPDTLTIKRRDVVCCLPGDSGCGDPCNPETDIVWDLESYKLFINDGGPAPPTINPSLWRNSQLNVRYGLYRVAGTDGPNSPDLPAEGALLFDPNLITALADGPGSIYQVRSYDLSNITFVRGNSGWIVFDPLISPETAEAALHFINETLQPANPNVSAVIYSHSHIDHYGGAAGLFGRDGTGSAYKAPPANVAFIAPDGFTGHAVSENVTAGPAMGRRAIFMYGALLPRDAMGGVNGGLGQTTSTGEGGLILPTVTVLEGNGSIEGSLVDSEGTSLTPGTVTSSGGKYFVDGVEMAFQMTPGTEAPAEMNTWLPGLKALWMAENTTNTMHNILTLRGAQVRDANKWVAFLNETLESWGDQAEVKFQSHHWPVWSSFPGATSELYQYLEKQRDSYKFLHDQTVRLMNNGYTGEEISEVIEDLLPGELETNWSTRGYYGTLRHNSRAVYQFYMGWYDGHPSDLNNLPPEMVAARYVDYMERAGTVYDKALADFNNANATVDDYRWVAEVMKHAVYNNPTDANKKLLANALEQLGYMAESGPWRSVYLQGAYELRITKELTGGTETATPATIRAMLPEMIFDYLAVHLCGKSWAEMQAEARPEVLAWFDDAECTAGAAGEDIAMDMQITDWNGGTIFNLTVENGVLNYREVEQMTSAPVKLSTTMAGLQNLLIEHSSSGITVDQDPSSDYPKFQSMLDLDDEFFFNIVTP